MDTMEEKQCSQTLAAGSLEHVWATYDLVCRLPWTSLIPRPLFPGNETSQHCHEMIMHVTYSSFVLSGLPISQFFDH